MDQYLNLLAYVRYTGQDREDRTGVGTRSVFGEKMEFDLTKRFPLMTTKKINTKAVVTELLWMLRGGTNIKYLNDHGVHIWDQWADESGDLGPVYGAQWRNWPSTEGYEIDQVEELLESLQNNPYSRRHILTAWNPDEVPKMALPPCHLLAQFYVTTEGFLDCQLYQRSGDLFLGVPFNIASYALLTHLLATDIGIAPGRLIHVIGDAHIYSNHFEQVDEQLSRTPESQPTKVMFDRSLRLFDLKPSDITFEDYDPQPFIKAEVAV